MLIKGEDRMAIRAARGEDTPESTTTSGQTHLKGEIDSMLFESLCMRAVA